jgi:probable rRNA maturation factor
MITISNAAKEKINVDFLEKVASRVLKNKKGQKDISVVLISGKEIKKLNKKYRKKDRATDVLSFPTGKSFFKEKDIGLGEIAMCVSEIKKNARADKSPFQKELAFVLIHGILHLFGYEHEEGGEKEEKMKRREKYYLAQIFKEE